MLYNPKAFFTHAAWLHQGFPHCAIFPTAASRRSSDRVSVPMWLIILSNQLEIVALVSRYLTNKLISSRHLQSQKVDESIPFFPPQGVCGISSRFQLLSPSTGQLPRHYSPVRRSTPYKSTEASLHRFRSTCMC